MCHEHFKSIWITGDTVFTDFNPTLFSKIFLVRGVPEVREHLYQCGNHKKCKKINLINARFLSLLSGQFL